MILNVTFFTFFFFILIDSYPSKCNFGNTYSKIDKLTFEFYHLSL